MNFQPAGAAVPEGYVADSGQAFGERGNGYSYGWDTANTSGVRERSKHADQRYDTLNHTQAYGARTWEVTVPNGQYQVHLVAGDAGYFNSVYKFNVEGVLTVDGTPTSGNSFVEGTQTVTVNDGLLTISNAAGASNNKLAYVQISAVDEPPPPTRFSAKINFQPSGAPVPAGYLVDAGAAYGDRGGGLTYGWVGGSNTTGLRDRNLSGSPDQRYDTLNHVNNKTWELAVANGQYNVRIVAGDAGYVDSVYRIDGEFQTAIVSGTPNTASRWVEGNAMVWVMDGKLSISSGEGAFNNKICFIEVTAAEESPPIVNVSVHPAVEAAENGGSQVFTFSRTGDSSGPLGVYYAISGSATHGVDYESLVSPITFGAGEAQIYLTLTPINDADAEVTETATLTLVPHATYTIGTSSSASLRIRDDDTVSDGFSARINFQPQDAALPSGYAPDIGWSFQSHGNGLAYGWSSTNLDAARDRNATNSPDQRYDTLAHFSGRTWNLAVPNGIYAVRIVAGDAGFFDSTYHVTAEGASVVNGKPTSGGRWLEGTATVAVSDGKLTLASGAGAFNNKICFIDVAQLESPAGTTITWTTRASNPIARAEALKAVVNGKLYLFGGFQGDGPSRRHDVYDPATNVWTRLADLPTRLTHAGVAVDGQSIYVAGGYVGTSSTGWSQKFGVTNVWKYDVAANQWTAFTALPKEVAGGGMVLLGRELHWVGGNNNQRQDIGDHFVLNLDNAAAGWQTAAPLPSGRSHLGVVALGGKIYAVGGQFGNDDALTAQKLVHAYDPATNAWTRLADMPTAIGHIASATFTMGNRIITAGGETAHGVATDLVYAYDLATNTWSGMTNLPARRFSGVAAMLGDDIYFTTGSTQTTTWKGVVS